MKKNKLTLIGLAISVTIWLATFISGTDLFEILVNGLEKLEKFEVDELIIPIAIFFIFALLDLFTKHRRQTIEIEKIKIYHAMLSSTHHILNNFLNKMQLFKISAEESDVFPESVIELYDQIIQDAVKQIESMGSIMSIDEVSIRASVEP